MEASLNARSRLVEASEHEAIQEAIKIENERVQKQNKDIACLLDTLEHASVSFNKGLNKALRKMSEAVLELDFDRASEVKIKNKPVDLPEHPNPTALRVSNELLDFAGHAIDHVKSLLREAQTTTELHKPVKFATISALMLLASEQIDLANLIANYDSSAGYMKKIWKHLESTEYLKNPEPGFLPESVQDFIS